MTKEELQLSIKMNNKTANLLKLEILIKQVITNKHIDKQRD